MSQARRRRIQIGAVFLWIVLVMVAVAAVLGFRLLLFSLTPTPKLEASTKIFIRPGTGAHAVAALLEKEGVITQANLFYWYARVRGMAGKMKAGEYQFSAAPTPKLVLETLVEGKVVAYKVTIPEGATVKDVARLVAASGLADTDEILELARDRHLVTSLGLPDSTSLEGYLFPETYLFRRSDRPRDILKRMVLEFWRRFSPERQAQARRMGFTVHETVTLASLVEKEAVMDRERPVIAGVFLNRLQRNMPLQSDPTAVYDLEDFSGPILRRHLERESPYNTYVHKGLPPGPICNPGEKSLRAVLEAQKTPFLYFVSNNDGSHTFSSSYDEHLQAVARVRALKRENRNGAKLEADHLKTEDIP
ncbi:MAG: endolytic transglycosylase MltG [Desulfosoma sp.]